MGRRHERAWSARTKFGLVPVWAAASVFGWGFAAAGELRPDLGGYARTVVPFVEKHCLECHDEATKKGDLSLEDVDPDVVGGSGLETWRTILDQIQFDEMPPEKEARPDGAERDAVVAWIRGELLKTQQPGVVADEKLLLPQFGNYVDHEYLFGERLPHVTPAPPRLWRLRPDIYDTVLPSLGNDINGLANGLSEADGPEFKDYAASYAIDEASASPLLGNAKTVADSLLGERSRDRVFKELVSEDGPPSEDMVSEFIANAFHKILGRAPTDEESERFAGFYQKASGIGGYRSAAKALLTAILMQPEVLFRQELGDGNPDAHGRVRLSQREIRSP